MKKNIILVMFIIAISSNVFAQYIVADFEENGIGTDWAWIVGENGDNPPMEFIANPDMSGSNTSATVAQFTARQNGQPWALCFTDDIDEFEFNATNTTVKIMVHKPVISNVALKFEGSGPDIELQQANTVINEWEELTFDFSSMIGNAYNRLIIIPDFQERDQDHVLYLDNIQLPEMNVDPTPEPTEPAPGPSQPAENVISLFSDSYNDVPVDSWSAEWDVADVADVFIEGNITKLYTNFTYAGIEFTSQTIDATDMTHFHLDVWTPDDTSSPAVFKVKLVDFGPDGVWGNDDTEHELTFDENTMNTEAWVSLDIPLSNFTGLTSTEHLAQLILSGDPNTIYVDNIYFHSGESAPNEPEIAAPTPTVPAENVISLFSNAYTDAMVDTWSADWDVADVTDIMIDGNDTKLFTNLSYAGIEFTSQTIDATDMTHFHMDLWTPDNTDDPSVFKVKIVDFGADGAWGGDDDVEHELIFDENTMDSEVWVSLDIALSEFTGLTTTGHLAQLIISGDPNTIYIDNIFFYEESSSSTTESINSNNAIGELGKNYPNPFNPSTTIDYSLKQQGSVLLQVYNAKGQLVETLVNESQQASSYQVNWNADKNASGIYLYRLKVNGQIVDTKRMILMK